MVYQADRMANEFGLEESASAVYAQVEKGFPQTRGAEVARQRLEQLRHEGGGKEG
jgi:TolA-binding protein